MYKRLSGIITGIMLFSLIVTGCTSQAGNIGHARENSRQPVDTGFILAEAGSYDSADTAVVLSVSPDIGYITFMNIATGKQYTLSYDGTTYVKDKYESPMTMSQIQKGDIVDITFLKSKKRLASVQLSPKAWVFNDVKNYDLGGINHTARIGSDIYSLSDQIIVLSENEQTEIMGVVDKDVLTIKGIDHEIYSIAVERGHGYLRLSNEQPLIGGWIEVGNAVIRTITEDMLLIVPEGSYQVMLKNGDASIVKDVEIKRDKEFILDVGDIKIAEDKKGIVLFSVTPETAKVSVDGELIDISKEVELDYGIHKVKLEAEGYRTLTKYIQVGAEYASIKFTMEEETNLAEDGDTSYDISSVSDNDDTDEIAEALNSTDNTVYIDSPKKVEVYLDGNYIGLSPVSFKKVTGSHTITLRKEGCQSKSYTIYLYNDGEDITYSFPELEKIEEEENNKEENSKKEKEDNKGNDKNSEGTVSGNDNKDDNGTNKDEESQVSGNSSVDADEKNNGTDSNTSGDGNDTEDESKDDQPAKDGNSDLAEDVSVKKESIFVKIGRYISELFH